MPDTSYRHHPMSLHDAVRELLRYLQARYTDPHDWVVYAEEFICFEGALRDAAQKLWAYTDVLYAANPTLARACLIATAHIEHDREYWEKACRAVWESLIEEEHRSCQP